MIKNIIFMPLPLRSLHSTHLGALGVYNTKKYGYFYEKILMEITCLIALCVCIPEKKLNFKIFLYVTKLYNVA